MNELDWLIALNVLGLTFFCLIMKMISKVLDKPYPWETLPNLRAEMENAYDMDNLSDSTRARHRSCAFQSQVNKLFMVFLTLQGILIGHLLVEKTRWSELAAEIAEHYRNQSVRPITDPVSLFEYDSFFGIILYIVLVNAVAVYMIYTMRKLYIDQQRRNIVVLVDFSSTPFVVIWAVLTHKILDFCTQHEDAFLKLIEEKKAPEQFNIADILSNITLEDVMRFW